MRPSNLQPEHFAAYPPAGKHLALTNLPLLRALPLSFLPSLLREIVAFDYKFPAERTATGNELATLNSLTQPQLQQWFQGFSSLILSADLERLDWTNSPAQFVEQESAYLWKTHQLDAFRNAATAYGERLQNSSKVSPVLVDRLGIAVVGQGVADWNVPLFRNLRPHGTYFRNLKPANGLELLLAALAERAETNPVPFGHWYIDGGQPSPQTAHSLTCVSYRRLDPVRAALLRHIDAMVERPGMGPEELRTDLARLMPSDLGLADTGETILDRFQVKVLTEGSGTQIFSTTFVQWTTREALRRAQPLTLLARYAPRQRQRPMNELLSDSSVESDIDPAGSIVDADMGAYYHWIDQQRLPGAERSVFLVWFEGQSEAVAISSKLARGTESGAALNLGELLAMATS